MDWNGSGRRAVRHAAPVNGDVRPPGAVFFEKRMLSNFAAAPYRVCEMIEFAGAPEYSNENVIFRSRPQP